MAASKKTPEVEQAIIDAVRNGAYAKHAALAAGVSEATLYSWQQSDPELAEAIERAVAERANAAIRRIEGHAERNWQADAWLLERTMPAFFREQKSQELSGSVNLAGLADLADAQ
jgi:transposase